MDRWQGKIAVVTGASAGIGKDIADKLVEYGLKVVGLARRVEMVEDHAKCLQGKPGKLYAMKCDVSKDTEVKRVFEEIKKTIGPVAILVNNAGIIKKNSFIDGDPAVWKQILDINMYGLAVCTHEAIKQMRETDDCGHIININSIVGHKIIDANPQDMSMYPSSKHGVTAFTEVVRQELRNRNSKIKITSISPGVVATDIFKSGDYSEFSEVMEEVPHLNPEDISEGIIYALCTKPHVQVHELTIKPIGETF